MTTHSPAKVIRRCPRDGGFLTLALDEDGNIVLECIWCDHKEMLIKLPKHSWRQPSMMRRYYSRKVRGLCVHCGKPKDTNKVLCSECINKLKETKDKTEYKDGQLAYKRDYSSKHIIAGLCRQCSRPAKEGSTRCQHCLDLQAKYRNGKREALV